jgi:hypothetical protein
MQPRGSDNLTRAARARYSARILRSATSFAYIS